MRLIIKKQNKFFTKEYKS